MKRLIALIMALAVTLGLTGCGGGGNQQLGDGDDVILSFSLYDLGYGTQWLDESCDRFMELMKDKEYPGGKKGVFCNIEKGTTPKATELPTSGHHVIFDLNARSGSNSGNLLLLSADGKNAITGADEAEQGINIFAEIYGDGTESLAGMIPDELVYNVTGNDGEFYGIPTYKNTTGVTYDKHLFDIRGLYFAKPGTPEGEYITYDGCEEIGEIVIGYDEVNEEDIYLTFNFVDVSAPNWESNRSCGPDGVFETLDDGLPSSLFEFIALCSYMDSLGIEPMVMSGLYAEIYSNTFTDGLSYSLLGEDKARVTRDMQGTLDVVTTFSEEPYGTKSYTPLAPGLTYVPQAVTASVEVTEETGFYNMWTVERYYTYAMMEIMYKEGWLGTGSNPSVNPLSHLDIQNKFIHSGYNDMFGTCQEVGMLMESAYWYNESNIRGNLEDFYLYNEDVEDREVRWMSLPVNIANTVTGEDKTATTFGITESVKGEKNVMPQSSNNMVSFNKRVMEDDAVWEAFQDWFKFYFSDEELANLTLSQGMDRLLDYELPADKKDDWFGFYRHMNELEKESVFLYESSDVSPTYNEALLKEWGIGEGGKWTFAQGYSFGYGMYLGKISATASFKDKFGNVDGQLGRIGFLSMCWSPEQWKTYYKGNKISDVKYAVDRNGKTIQYKTPWYDVV